MSNIDAIGVLTEEVLHPPDGVTALGVMVQEVLIPGTGQNSIGVLVEEVLIPQIDFVDVFGIIASEVLNPPVGISAIGMMVQEVLISDAPTEYIDAFGILVEEVIHPRGVFGYGLMVEEVVIPPPGVARLWTGSVAARDVVVVGFISSQGGVVHHVGALPQASFGSTAWVPGTQFSRRTMVPTLDGGGAWMPDGVVADFQAEISGTDPVVLWNSLHEDGKIRLPISSPGLTALYGRVLVHGGDGAVFMVRAVIQNSPIAVLYSAAEPIFEVEPGAFSVTVVAVSGELQVRVVANEIDFVPATVSGVLRIGYDRFPEAS